ncbi:hypothetical protein Bbelb_176980 [Branchiostoma belcheri]|nr:hypothetical protein Bbelb_176980 [Branchiostoma belcheri]
MNETSFKQKHVSFCSLSTPAQVYKKVELGLVNSWAQWNGQFGRPEPERTLNGHAGSQRSTPTEILLVLEVLQRESTQPHGTNVPWYNATRQYGGKVKHSIYITSTTEPLKSTGSTRLALTLSTLEKTYYPALQKAKSFSGSVIPYDGRLSPVKAHDSTIHHSLLCVPSKPTDQNTNIPAKEFFSSGFGKEGIMRYLAHTYVRGPDRVRISDAIPACPLPARCVNVGGAEAPGRVGRSTHYCRAPNQTDCAPSCAALSTPDANSSRQVTIDAPITHLFTWPRQTRGPGNGAGAAMRGQKITPVSRAKLNFRLFPMERLSEGCRVALTCSGNQAHDHVLSPLSPEHAQDSADSASFHGYSPESDGGLVVSVLEMTRRRLGGRALPTGGFSTFPRMSIEVDVVQVRGKAGTGIPGARECPRVLIFSICKTTFSIREDFLRD